MAHRSDGFACQHIVHVHNTVRTPRVDVPLPGSLLRRKVAPNQRLEHLVPPVCHQRRVVRVDVVPSCSWVLHHAVVPVVQLSDRVHPPQVLGARHPPDIPQLTALILSIRHQMPPISLGSNVRNPLRVSNQDPLWLRVRPRPQHPPVPHLDEAVVTSGENNIAPITIIGKRHRVNVAVVRLHLGHQRLALDIKDTHTEVVAPSHNLLPPRTESQAENAKRVAVPQAHALMQLILALYVCQACFARHARVAHKLATRSHINIGDRPPHVPRLDRLCRPELPTHNLSVEYNNLLALRTAHIVPPVAAVPP
eukprot:CAMPEP_0173404334 /NCGR_PEP_ID=MMETSP1356-20130122/59131_1 /TAXON_ID=77927 ORGANISM="Hemiselmis virescens, Strain PCC157" /NCGR_SAMPLE_ID=MMETSP1356 /ASSEMBLY_ACC=CAM_ASM_000847 /LENGTH=307 /DNA_ID=CAMNT_0014364991 /DNA_START=115 /DNA_END=1035 /DNA_ORIENTATION=+